MAPRYPKRRYRLKRKSRKYKRKYRRARARYHGIGRGRHNFVQSAPSRPQGLWAPEVYSTLSTALDIKEPFAFELEAGNVSKNAICPLAKMRPMLPRDFLATLPKLTEQTENGEKNHILHAWDEVNVGSSGGNFMAAEGKQPVGWPTLQSVYARSMTFRCQASFTLMAQSHIQNLGAIDGKIAAGDLANATDKVALLPKAGQQVLQYVWFGVTIMNEEPNPGGLDRCGKLKNSINDMMTQEGTMMKLVNISQGNPSCTLDIDVDIQKWLGTKMTDISHGAITSDTDNKSYPLKQIFLVPWIAPAADVGGLYDQFNRATNAILPLNRAVCPVKFCLHYKALFTTKLYQQQNVTLEPASANIGDQG